MARILVATAHHHILEHLTVAMRGRGHTVVGVVSAGAVPAMQGVVERLGLEHVALPLLPGELNIGRGMRNDPAYAAAMRTCTAGLPSLNADFLVGWAIHVLPPFLLEVATEAINVHPSDLPRYRGGFPLEAQILAGERMLHISVHRTIRAIDAGEVLARSQPLKIKRSDTMTSLLNRSLPVGAGLAADVVTHWGRLPPVERPHSPDTPPAWGLKRVRAPDGTPHNAGVLGRLRIAWNVDSTRDIARSARAFDMIGGALTDHGSHLFRIRSAKPVAPTTMGRVGEVLAVGDGTWDVQAHDGVVRVRGGFMDPAGAIEVGDCFASSEPISRVIGFVGAERSAYHTHRR